jgi:serine/threonine protein kinase/tetratricopeptide (TPR) repeat protein
VVDDRHDTEHPELTELGAPTSSRPERIGHYRILQKIGEGGMGEVYKAEQEKPFRRVVAVKVIKPGMDSKAVVARFESERQALALMDHTNIARVFDAGTTEQGRPYFVMEYARGVPIDEYCDMNRLKTSERLELFVQVCEGVHHAHQKGIIHRDIKASNVLVVIQDDKPIPKIIDFGVAKATGRELTERTAFTELGQLIGTPEYMSPEQAEMTGLDVDIRTDVYSLGVLLYKLLVGTRPFDMGSAMLSGIGEVLRKIREEEPQKPSMRATSRSETSTTAARARRTDQASLAKRLRGDLDWITMKALEKDRTRRYASVSELSADILRHLRDEPVLAGPPSTMYSLGKYVRRHKTAVGFAVVVFALLVAFAVTMAFQAGRIALERDRANQEAATAREISSFLEGIFEVSDPSEGRGNTITARELLNSGAEKIHRELEGQPIVQARFLESIGRVYRSLGLYDRARPQLERALEIRRGIQEEGHADIARSLNELALLLHMMEDYAGARPLYEEALAIGEKSLGPYHLDVARSLMGLANLHFEAGEYDLARPLHERVLRIREQALGAEHPVVAETLADLGTLNFKTGDYDAALPLYRRALEIRERVLHPEHPALADSLYHLGSLYRKTKDLEAAQLANERALEIRESILDPDHPDMAESLYALANVYFLKGDYAAAQPLFERALEIQQKVFSHDSPALAATLNSLAALHYSKRDYAAAQSLYERVLAILEEARGPNHIEVAAPLRNLGLLMRKMKNHAAALSYYERALEIQRRVLGPDNPEVVASQMNLAVSLHNLANVHHDAGDYDSSLAYYRRAFEISDKAGNPRAKIILYNMACCSARAGDRDAALDFLRRALDRGYAKDGMLSDSDLDALRGMPEFEAIVAEVETRLR